MRDVTAGGMCALRRAVQIRAGPVGDGARPRGGGRGRIGHGGVVHRAAEDPLAEEHHGTVHLRSDGASRGGREGPGAPAAGNTHFFVGTWQPLTVREKLFPEGRGCRGTNGR